MEKSIKNMLRDSSHSKLLESITLEAIQTIIPSFIGTLNDLMHKNPEIKSEFMELMYVVWWVDHNFYKLTNNEIEVYLLEQLAPLNRELNENEYTITTLRKNLSELKKSFQNLQQKHQKQ